VWQALDAQIAEDDLVRVISQSVDDGIFDVEAVFDIYSGRGRAAHPPDLLLKLVLYEHCRGQTKPAQWHEDLQSNIKVQWLVFGLKVSPKGLYRFRDRVGPLLQGWHKQVLERAVAEELVDGRQASIDGTTVAANASRRKLGNLQQVEARLEALEQALLISRQMTCQDARSQDPTNASCEPGWMAKTVTGKLEQHARYGHARERLCELHAENKKRRSDKRKPEDRIVVSLTDPDSVFGRDKEKVYRPLYSNP
jgi:transposase